MASRPGRGHAIPRLRQTVTESLGIGTPCVEERQEVAWVDWAPGRAGLEAALTGWWIDSWSTHLYKPLFKGVILPLRGWSTLLAVPLFSSVYVA